jgi:hypothetical protein
MLCTQTFNFLETFLFSGYLCHKIEVVILKRARRGHGARAGPQTRARTRAAVAALLPVVGKEKGMDRANGRALHNSERGRREVGKAQRPFGLSPQAKGRRGEQTWAGEGGRKLGRPG